MIQVFGLEMSAGNPFPAPGETAYSVRSEDVLRGVVGEVDVEDEVAFHVTDDVARRHVECRCARRGHVDGDRAVWEATLQLKRRTTKAPESASMDYLHNALSHY